MKSKNIFLLSTVLLVLCLGFGACNRCERNPCRCATPTNADFVILEHSDWHLDSDYITDTIMQGNYARFRALHQDMGSYEWKIGNDPRTFSDSSFQLSFDDSMSIKVQLIVEQNLACFTQAERKDTVIKYLRVAHFSEWRFNGEYEGTLTHIPNQSTTIEIYENIPGLGYYISGIGDTDCPNEISVGALYNRVTLSTGCNVYGGVGTLLDNNILSLEYKYFDINIGGLATTTFQGIKK